MRIHVGHTDERLARVLLSDELQRAFAHLPRGSALRYDDGFVRFFMPGARRGERDVDAAVLVARLACRPLVFESG